MLAGKPENIEQYEKLSYQDINVFIPIYGIYDLDGITISFDKNDGFGRLKIKGLQTVTNITCFYDNHLTSTARVLLEEITGSK